MIFKGHMMKWLKTGLLVLLLAPVLAMASQIEIEVTGRGLTEDAAVEQALIRAVRQIHGTDINSSQESIQEKSHKNGKTDIRLDTRQGSSMHARGQVASYDILDSECRAAGCEVRLVARVHQYKEPGMASVNRRKLAVVPFKGGNYSFSKKLTEQLEEELVQSRRFAMLDRTKRKELEAEKTLWQSGNTPIAEKAKLGQMLGLDYMLFGTVKESRVKRWTKKVELTGEEKHYAETFATVRYEMISVATGQVKWADTVTLRKSGAVLNRAASDIAGRISQTLLTNIFPLRVVGLAGGQVVLNQGGKTLNTGDRFNIYAVGEKLVDPYTREVLGQAESEIATVRIVRVTAKAAYAEIISGSRDQIKALQIARKAKPVVKQQTSPRRSVKPVVKSNTELADEGGVIL